MNNLSATLVGNVRGIAAQPRGRAATVTLLMLVILAAISMLLPTRAVHAAECLLRFGWEPYAVYTFRDASGSAAGADVAILKAVNDDLNCTLVFEELPWARILLEIENGNVDVTSSASQTADREAFAWFSQPYRHAETALYFRPNDPNAAKLTALDDIVALNLRLGVITGYYYGDFFQALMRNPRFAAQVEAATDYETNIRKLINGRIDAYLVEDVGVMIAEAGTLGVTEQVERHPLKLPGEAFHYMLSRKSVDEALFAEFDRSLGRLKANGRLRAIIAEFLKD